MRICVKIEEKAMTVRAEKRQKAGDALSIHW